MKFSSRRKSRQYLTSYSLFRPRLINQVIRARDRLIAAQASAATTSGYFTDAVVPGIGRCVVSFEDIAAAIVAYNGLIQRYALHVSCRLYFPLIVFLFLSTF